MNQKYRKEKILQDLKKKFEIFEEKVFWGAKFKFWKLWLNSSSCKNKTYYLNILSKF